MLKQREVVTDDQMITLITSNHSYEYNKINWKCKQFILIFRLHYVAHIFLFADSPNITK